MGVHRLRTSLLSLFATDDIVPGCHPTTFESIVLEDPDEIAPVRSVILALTDSKHLNGENIRSQEFNFRPQAGKIDLLDTLAGRNHPRSLYTMLMVDCRLLIFDMDGTLLDTFPGIMRTLNLALAELEMPAVDLGWVKKHVGRGASRLIADASGGRVDAAELHRAFRHYYSRVIVEESRPFPGVEESLEKLAQHHELALASNKPDFWIHEVLRGLGWEGRFASVMGPQSAGAHKPDPSMIDRILEETGIRRDESILIGDMPVDAETGRAAGIPALGVLTGATSAQELLDAGCIETLDGVPDLPAWLERKRGVCP